MVNEFTEKDLYDVPNNEQYLPYKEELISMVKEVQTLPYSDVYVNSFDGARLHGRYYKGNAGMPLKIMFHGYKSSAWRDFSGGLTLAVANGFSVLAVDQRAHGESEGKCLTFGVKERKDCLAFVNYAIEQYGSDVEIILMGMSMGAATVLMAAGPELPKNVIGIIADCGYSSPKAIIKSVIADMRLPQFPFYLLVRLGGILYGGFDIESASAAETMKNCKVPVLFIHGIADRFVPVDMGKDNYNACASVNKKIFLVENAGHGMSFVLDKNGYIKATEDFEKSIIKG